MMAGPSSKLCHDLNGRMIVYIAFVLFWDFQMMSNEVQATTIEFRKIKFQNQKMENYR